MKLHSYSKFINESKLGIDSICDKYGITNYTINNDGTVDVSGHVYLYPDHPSLSLLKLPLKFGKVTGNFNCAGNMLTSLDGCPTEVGGFFNCSVNRLESLKGSPKEIGGYFNCSENLLTSLEGCPYEVGGDFSCCYNSLISLEGSPKKIGGRFIGHENKLTDLKGFPLIIHNDDVSIFGNPVYSYLFKLFDRDKWLEAIEFTNEYDVIRDGDKIILQALELVYDELGLEVPENIEVYGYKII